jgi:RNase P subunit RPR2
MADEEDLRNEIPTHAYIALARRGMEKISLDQCFLKNCDNNDPKLLEPYKKEESESDKEQIKKIHIKCKKCGGIFILKLKTLKYVAKSTKDSDEEPLSMGLVYALDENEKNLGHIGYF